MSRAAFFFGSGISRASGAPMVDELTDTLLNGAWKPHTDWKFYQCTQADGPKCLGVAARAQEFLRAIKTEIDPHLLEREGHGANYEDLYAAAFQIFQDETAEITSPLMCRSFKAIKAATASLYIGQDYHIDKNPFVSLADRACDLVQWNVYYGLSRAKIPVGMDVIADVARRVTTLDIFTLNHETLIEQCLREAGIDFADGFGDRKGDVRIFASRWNGPIVRVLKLHGSTNWFLFRFPEWDQFASVEANSGYARDEQGRLLDDLDPKPLFLTGTTVKEQSYGVSLIGDLFSKFRELLSAHDTLIFCGYGWGDKGINIRLSQWLRNKKENRLVILHDGPEEEIANKRFWRLRWADYLRAGKVVLRRQWLANCTVSDLEPFFDS
jgi:hypothetical protein